MIHCNQVCMYNFPDDGCLKPASAVCPMSNMARDTNVLTNADHIRSMSDEELAEFLEHIAYESVPVWTEPFDKVFCQTCSAEPCFAGACPNGKGSLWWLKQPAEEKRALLEHANALRRAEEDA